MFNPEKMKGLMPALAMILYRGGNMKLERGRLKVSLRRFRDSKVDYAVRRICKELNAMELKTLDKFRLPILYEVL